MKKIIACLIIIVLPVLAAAQTNILLKTQLHYTPITYNNSGKDKGASRGLYFYWGHGLNHSFEGALDHTWLKYIDETETAQNDLTVKYTNYHYYGYKFMLGARNINGDINGNIATLFGGINNYIIGKREIQLNFFYSRYGETEGWLKVFQITPEYGRVLMKGPLSSIYAEIKGHYIHLSQDMELDQKIFYSAELSLTYYYKKLRITAFGWEGEQVFAVREGGFVVYNMPHRYTGGYGVKAGLSLSKTTNVVLGYARDDFNTATNHPDTRDTSGPSSSMFSLSIAHTF